MLHFLFTDGCNRNRGARCEIEILSLAWFSYSTAWRVSPSSCPSTPTRPASRNTQSQSTSLFTLSPRASKTPRRKWGKIRTPARFEALPAFLSLHKNVLTPTSLRPTGNSRPPSPGLSQCATIPTPRASKCWTTPSSSGTWPTASTVCHSVSFCWHQHVFLIYRDTINWRKSL